MVATDPPAMAWSQENCAVTRTMAVLGERWTMVVVRDVLLGVRRFDDLRRRNGMPRQVLTDRLHRLVEKGILRRVPYRVAGARERHEYRPTERGLELYPVLVAINDWGVRHLGDPEGAPIDAVHRGCGAEVHAALVCDAGHHVTEPRHVGTRPGPAAVPADRSPPGLRDQNGGGPS